MVERTPQSLTSSFTHRADGLRQPTAQASGCSRRQVVGSLDLLERDAKGLVIVDLKTAARRYSDVRVEASLQLSIYSYATAMLGFANQADLRLGFDVLTKTTQPELHRYRTARDRAANVRLFRLASEVLRAIEAEVFPPNVGWQCRDCQFRSKCWAWR